MARGKGPNVERYLREIRELKRELGLSHHDAIHLRQEMNARGIMNTAAMVAAHRNKPPLKAAASTPVRELLNRSDRVVEMMEAAGELIRIAGSHDLAEKALNSYHDLDEPGIDIARIGQEEMA